MSPPDGEINGEITENELTLLAIIKENPTATNSQISKLSGKSERTISRLLAMLKRKKLIERIGSNKSGYWKVL